MARFFFSYKCFNVCISFVSKFIESVYSSPSSPQHTKKKKTLPVVAILQ